MQLIASILDLSKHVYFTFNDDKHTYIIKQVLNKNLFNHLRYVSFSNHY